MRTFSSKIHQDKISQFSQMKINTLSSLYELISKHLERQDCRLKLSSDYKELAVIIETGQEKDEESLRLILKSQAFVLDQESNIIKRSNFVMKEPVRLIKGINSIRNILFVSKIKHLLLSKLIYRFSLYNQSLRKEYKCFFYGLKCFKLLSGLKVDFCSKSTCNRLKLLKYLNFRFECQNAN